MLIKGQKYPQIGIATKLKHGDDFYKRIGAIGGSRKGPKGFAQNRELARIAGAKGGRSSRRAWTLAERRRHSDSMRRVYAKG